MALPPEDVDAIRATADALAEAFEAPDPTAWVDFYADDAVFVSTGSPAVEGREALLAMAPHIRLTEAVLTLESVIGDGDVAAALGRGSWVGGATGERVRRRFLIVWRREADGRWRIAREMLDEDVAPPA